jgi:Zn-dependent protease with chaperone function
VDRELVLAVLVLLVCGPALHLFALVPAGSLEDRSGRRLEEISWARLWLPVLPASIALCLLIGWALQEPDHSDERLLPLVFVIVSPFAIVAVRAGARAARALVTSDRATAGTVGLLRPRVFFAQALLDALDPEAVAAARLHEDAHVLVLPSLYAWIEARRGSDATGVA